MKVFLFLLFVVGIVFVAVGSCNQEPAFVTQLGIDNPSAPTRTATLLPAVIATAQSAEAASQATQAFGRGQMAQMDVTGTALAIEREVVSMQMTQAAATAESFQTQTAEAVHTTQTAEAAQIATANAYATETRQVFYDGGTATAETVIQAGKATETQAALIVILAAAEAEAQRIRDEQATQNLRTWLWRGFWTVIMVSVSTILIWTMIEFRRAILSRMLIVRNGPKGRGTPYIQNLQADGSAKWTDMRKAAGAVIDIPAIGDAQVQGMLDDPQMQTYIAVQAALADMLLALNTTTAEHRWPWEKDGQSHSPERHKARTGISAALLQRAAQQQAMLSSLQAGQRYLPSEIVDTQFREAPHGDKDVDSWLDDVQSKLLD